jgi:hypothetical protein
MKTKSFIYNEASMGVQWGHTMGVGPQQIIDNPRKEFNGGRATANN